MIGRCVFRMVAFEQVPYRDATLLERKTFFRNPMMEPSWTGQWRGRNARPSMQLYAPKQNAHQKKTAWIIPAAFVSCLLCLSSHCLQSKYTIRDIMLLLVQYNIIAVIHRETGHRRLEGEITRTSSFVRAGGRRRRAGIR
jgi:hypothetical protein